MSIAQNLTEVNVHYEFFKHDSGYYDNLLYVVVKIPWNNSFHKTPIDLEQAMANAYAPVYKVLIILYMSKVIGLDKQTFGA